MMASIGAFWLASSLCIFGWMLLSCGETMPLLYFPIGTSEFSLLSALDFFEFVSYFLVTRFFFLFVQSVSSLYQSFDVIRNPIKQVLLSKGLVSLTNPYAVMGELDLTHKFILTHRGLNPRPHCVPNRGQTDLAKEVIFQFQARKNISSISCYQQEKNRVGAPQSGIQNRDALLYSFFYQTGCASNFKLIFSRNFKYFKQRRHPWYSSGYDHGNVGLRVFLIRF